jgi:hypothetical protein
MWRGSGGFGVSAEGGRGRGSGRGSGSSIPFRSLLTPEFAFKKNHRYTPRTIILKPIREHLVGGVKV